MKTELYYLTLVTALTGFLWVPYIVDRLVTRGPSDALGYGEPARSQSAWAVRLQRAHVNAVENLVVFATLILIAQAAGLSNAGIATAAIVYFWSRVVHAVAYAFAIPLVRTLAFFGGVIAQVMVGWQLLAMH